MVYFKRILFILLILMFSLSTFSFGFTEQSTTLNNNSATYITARYEAICSDLVSKLNRYKGKVDICDDIIDLLSKGRYDYYVSYADRTKDGVSYPNQSSLNIYFYYPNNTNTVVTDYNLGYYNVQTQFVKNTPNYYAYYNLQTQGDGSVFFSLTAEWEHSPASSRTFMQPYILYGYRSPYINSWLIDQTDKSAESIVSAVQQLNDSLTDTDPSSADDNVISSIDTNTGVNDTTDAGFTWIFNKFYNSITEEARGIEVPIPFANTSFTIDPNATRNALGNDSWIITTLSSFWYFIVGLFIYKDMQKLIQKIQNGSIGQSTDTNIKADML